MSQPQNQDCHTLQRVDVARPFFVLPAIKIEIENSLEMALSKAKSGARGNPVFGSLEPCEALYTQIKPQCKQRIHPLLNMYYYSSTG